MDEGKCAACPFAIHESASRTPHSGLAARYGEPAEVFGEPASLGKVFRRRARIFLPEDFTMLGVEVNSPHPVGLPVRAQAADVDREVVESIAARGGSGFLDQGDGHPVIGVDTGRLGEKSR